MTLPNFTKLLTTYAQMIVEIGAGIQRDDIVYVEADIAQTELVHLLTSAAYRLGAAEVIVNWNDDFLTHEFLLHASEKRLGTFKEAKRQETAYLLEHQAKRINVVSSIPGALDGVKHERLALFQSTNAIGLRPLRQASQNNDISWTVVAAANPAWAQKIFPQMTKEAANDELWHQIFQATRIYSEDPVRAWRQHVRRLDQRAQQLNDYQFDRLVYRAPGTALTVGLPQHHIWESAGATNRQGQPFIPNMPTEEVFTAPDKNRIDGHVTATKPLSYGGQIITGIRFDFRRGKISQIQAESGQQTLEHLLETDEGARSLGEVSLVPYSSPISQSNIIFYNTLFDENATNHLALGAAYPSSVAGGTKMNPLALQRHGLNVSTVHVDFMVGGSEMDVDGITKSGAIIPVFRHGEWAF